MNNLKHRIEVMQDEFDVLKVENQRLKNKIKMLRAGLNNTTLAEYLDIKGPYVSMYFTDNPLLPPAACSKLDKYFTKRIDIIGQNGNDGDHYE